MNAEVFQCLTPIPYPYPFPFPFPICSGSDSDHGQHPDVMTPILRSMLPVSAPSDNDWALGVDSQPSLEFPTLIRDGTSDRRELVACLMPDSLRRGLSRVVQRRE